MAGVERLDLIDLLQLPSAEEATRDHQQTKDAPN
jgi:hypothetical protein